MLISLMFAAERRRYGFALDRNCKAGELSCHVTTFIPIPANMNPELPFLLSNNPLLVENPK
jgi:hypothetical protein